MAKTTKIETKTQALGALRKAGWQKSRMQMTRGATTYRLAEFGGFGGPSITLSEAQIMVLGGGKWSLMSALLHIGNTQVHASGKVLKQIEELRERKLLGTEVGLFELAVALGKAIAQDKKAGALEEGPEEQEPLAKASSEG